MNVQAPAPHLRGDDACAAPDYTLAQRHAAIPEADHATWRALYARQLALFPRHAARASAALGVMGWRIVAVPGLLPDGAFFDPLAARRFPVTVWLRRPGEMDDLEEPDIFDDFLGHVPLLTNPDFACLLEGDGRLGEMAGHRGALKPLARLYRHMVEFGLTHEAGRRRAYGAGNLSSATETVCATESATPLRLRFDAARVLRSDDLQPSNFFIENHAELFALPPRPPEMLRAARDAAPIAPGARDASDHEI